MHYQYGNCLNDMLLNKVIMLYFYINCSHEERETLNNAAILPDELTPEDFSLTASVSQKYIFFY